MSWTNACKNNGCNMYINVRYGLSMLIIHTLVLAALDFYQANFKTKERLTN